MKTVTVKMAPAQEKWLEEQARARRISKGRVLRELIDAERNGAKPGSAGEALADLCGCVSGPRDLSTRGLKGYGRS